MQQVFVHFSHLINQTSIIRYYKLREQNTNLLFHYNSHKISSVTKLYWSSLREQKKSI